MSQEIKGTLSSSGNLIGHLAIGGGGTDNYPDLNNLPQINGVTLIGDKTSEDIGIDIPTKTSDLDNDSGFITSDALPTKVSELENDSGFITDSDLPTKVSDLENDTGFITSDALPTKTSDLDNDSGFVTISDVINDITSSDDQAYSSDKVESLIEGLLPVSTIAGAVASFSTDMAKPLVSLKADINAVQASGTPTPSTPLAISGWSKVNLYQLGGNFFDKDSENISSGYLINGAGNEVSYTDWSISDFVPVIEGARYYLYGLTSHPNTQQDNFELFDENKTKLGFANVKIYDQPYTIPSGVKYVKFSVKNSDLNTAQFGVSQNSVYCPYNSTINTEVINLGDTIYGGYVTKDDSGTKLVVTHSGLVSLGSFSWNTATSEGYSQSPSDISGMLKTASGSTIPDMFCTSLKVDTPTNVYNRVNDNSVSIASANSRLRIFMSSIAGYTNTQIQGVLSDVYIAYPLAEPIEIPLSDIPPFTTFIGTNNIFADSGDIEVKYKESIQKYIDDKIAETQALIL